MTDNQFDEFFRNKLGDYSSKVPEDMWRRIKEKKDKDRKVIILFLLLLLMVGIATSYFIFRTTENTNKEIIVSSQKHINNKDENVSPDQNKTHKTINMQPDTINRQQENKSLPNNEINKKNRENLNTTGYTIHKNNKTLFDKLAKEKNIDTWNNAEKNNGRVPKLSDQSFSKNAPDSLAGNFPNQIIMRPEDNIWIKQDNHKKSLLQKDSSLKEQQKVRNNRVSKDNESSIINNLSLEVYVSPDIPFSKTSSTNTAYLQRKDNASKMQLSYTVGFKLSTLFGDHILAKIGFQYAQINEKFSYTNKNAIRTVPVVIQRSFADGYGGIRTVLDTSNLMQAGTQYKLTYNHYKSIDVPILIGYETAGDRFKAALSTGIILNMKTSYNGDILDASLTPVDINSINVYKSNTGLSFYFGLGLATRLNNSLQLFTEPYIRYRFTNMTGTYQPLRQKINVGGLSFGLKYNFRK